MPVDSTHIGLIGQPVRMQIEYGKVREFAQAIGEALPTADPSEDPPEIAPPLTFLASLALWDDGRGRPALPVDRRRLLHGEHEVEFLRPLRLGDILTAVTRVIDVFAKPGRRGGRMTFVVLETTFTDPGGALVARTRNVLIETEGARNA